MSSMVAIQDDDSPLPRKTILERHRLISTIPAQADKELLAPYNAAQKSTCRGNGFLCPKENQQHRAVDRENKRILWFFGIGGYFTI